MREPNILRLGVERRRREDRDAEVAERIGVRGGNTTMYPLFVLVFPLPLGKGSTASSRKIFDVFGMEMVHFGGFWGVII
jgi:hypothetical protein